MSRTHGKAGTYASGCRCEACTHGSMVTQKRYRMATGANGRGRTPNPLLVDRGEAVAHWRALRASGWRADDLAAELGMSRSLLSWTMTNTRHTKIRRTTADAILALEPLRAVAVDDVVVHRLVVGFPDADWRALGATRDERLAAFERMDRRALRADLRARGYGDQQIDLPSSERVREYLGLRSADVKRVAA